MQRPFKGHDLEPLEGPHAELVEPRGPGTGADKIVAELRARATALGFDAFGIAAATARPDLPAKLRTALESGWHGDMHWLADTEERRGGPQALWPEARSVIMLGINYGPERDPLEQLAERGIGNI